MSAQMQRIIKEEEENIIRKLIRENTELKSTRKSVEAAAEQLKSDNSNLRTDNYKLKEENDKYRKDNYKTWKQKCHDLEDENKKLTKLQRNHQHELQKLQDELDSWREIATQLKSEVEDLKTRNADLRLMNETLDYIVSKYKGYRRYHDRS